MGDDALEQAAGGWRLYYHRRCLYKVATATSYGKAKEAILSGALELEGSE
jgi:hypothetical protein